MMRPKGSDRVMFNYIWKGTKRELLQWLDEEEREGELRKIFQNLADGAADDENKLKLLRLREALVLQYVDGGISRSSAEELVDEQVLPILTEAIETFTPQAGDSEDTLWAKLRAHMGLQLYDWAPACVDALAALGEDHIQAYLPALRAFVDSADFGRLDYGVMVTAYYEPDGVNEAFQLGDVIVELNGEPCRSYEEYVAQKEALSGPDYTVGVLRLNGSGELEQLALELNVDMPRVVLQSLNGKNFE